MGQIRWTARAARDLENIHTYISRDSEVYATRFVKSLVAATGKLEIMPRIGRVVPELVEHGFREVVYRNYRIIYRIVGTRDDAQILAIIHGARQIDAAVGQEWEL